MPNQGLELCKRHRLALEDVACDGTDSLNHREGELILRRSAICLVPRELRLDEVWGQEGGQDPSGVVARVVLNLEEPEEKRKGREASNFEESYKLCAR